MKRVLCVLLIFILLLSLSGCDVQTWFSKRFYNFHNYDGVLPQTIRVYSGEALERLVSAAHLSEEEFADFIKQARKPGSQFSMPRNTEKQHVEALARHMEKFGIPLIRDGVAPERFLLEYRPKSTWMSVTYHLEGITYRFVSRPYSMEEYFSVGYGYFSQEYDEFIFVGRDTAYLNWAGGSLIGELIQGDFHDGARIVYVILTPSVDLQTEFTWGGITG